MKRYLIIAFSILLASSLVSCFDFDNYEGPDATLSGKIVDQEGNPLWVESGGGMRIKLLDRGWGENPKEQYLKVRMDGTYTNTKLFASTYDIVAEGPFVPLIQTDDQGNITVDKTQKNVKVGKNTVVDFQVEPFLKVSWEAEPTLDTNGKLTAKFKIIRGTSNPDYQEDIFDVALFVSLTQYVGNNNYITQTLAKIDNPATATALIGQSATLTTPIALTSGNTYYVRVGARMDVTLFGGITYNYTDVKKITVP